MSDIATKLAEVYEKLSRASAPDRELDVLIGELTLRGEIERDDGDYFIAQHGAYPARLPLLTATVDAAQILLPKEWTWTVGSSIERGYGQTISARIVHVLETPRLCRIEVSENAPTLALALCKAIVRFYIEYVKEFPQEPS